MLKVQEDQLLLTSLANFFKLHKEFRLHKTLKDNLKIIILLMKIIIINYKQRLN